MQNFSVLFLTIFLSNKEKVDKFLVEICQLILDVPSTFDLVNFGLSLFKNPRKPSIFRPQVSTSSIINL